MAQPAVSRAVPFAIGAVLLIAGTVQFTAFKARALACCGAAPDDGRPLASDARRAWRDGLRLGVQCLRCCGNLMAILLVLGVMDPAVMAAVTVAVGVERIAPVGERVARLVGAAVILAGAVRSRGPSPSPDQRRPPAFWAGRRRLPRCCLTSSRLEVAGYSLHILNHDGRTPAWTA